MANKDNIRKWVEALRSGRYVQGMGFLRTGNSYCCLGVACEISGLGEWSDDPALRATRYVIGDSSSDLILPDAVAEWLGFGYGNPDLFFTLTDDLGDGVTLEGYAKASLAELNDHGYTFAKIADLIEAEWLKEDRPVASEEAASS